MISRRAWALGMLGVLLAPHSACGGGYTCTAYEGPESKPLELGVDRDLHALATNAGYFQVAVGAEGTIAAWYQGSFVGGSPDVHVWQVGSADLRGAWLEDGSWWAVGDAGTIVVTDNDGQSWDVVDVVPGAEDLFAMTAHAGRLVIVGDQIVLVRSIDGTWAEAPPPPEGWGELRGVYSDGERVFAVGRAGVIWTTQDLDQSWQLEPSGVDVDLNAVARVAESFGYQDEVVVVGDGGTVLLRVNGGWSPRFPDLDVDLIAYDDLRGLARDGGVYEFDPEGGATLRETIPGARALTYDFFGAQVTVGEGGAAYYFPDHECEENRR